MTYSLLQLQQVREAFEGLGCGIRAITHYTKQSEGKIYVEFFGDGLISLEELSRVAKALGLRNAQLPLYGRPVLYATLPEPPIEEKLEALEPRTLLRFKLAGDTDRCRLGELRIDRQRGREVLELSRVAKAYAYRPLSSIIEYQVLTPGETVTR